MSHNLAHHLLHALRFAPVFVVPLLVAMPGQYALADGSGCSVWGINGQTCIRVKGNGLSVKSVVGYFSKRTQACNWRYEIAYTDTNGNNYDTVRGPINSGCSKSGNLPITYTPYKRARAGRVCARLYERGSYVDAACVNITR